MRKHHGPYWWKWNKRTRKKEKKRKSTSCTVCFFNRCWKTSPLALPFAGKLYNVMNKFGIWGGNVYYVMVQLFLLFVGKEWSDTAASKEIKLETKHNTSVADMNKTNQRGRLIKMYFAVFFLFLMPVFVRFAWGYLRSQRWALWQGHWQDIVPRLRLRWSIGLRRICNRKDCLLSP